MQPQTSQRIAVVGRGRLGNALQNALEEAGLSCCPGPLGRGEDGQDADLVILCVPDRAIEAASGFDATGKKSASKSTKTVGIVSTSSGVGETNSSSSEYAVS